MKWKQNFDRKTLQRGHEIQRNRGVFTLAFDEKTMAIDAKVKGSYAPKYSVSVYLYPDSDREGWVDVDGVCSCPVGDNCKHAAAVMFEWFSGSSLSQGLVAPKPLDPETQWLTTVAKAAKQPQIPEENATKSTTGELVYVLHLDSGIGPHPVSMSFWEVRKLQAGGWGKPKKAVQEFSLLIQKDYLSDEDRTLLMDLFLLLPKYQFDRVHIHSSAAVRWLDRVVATGRCCWSHAQSSQVLSPSEALQAEAGWKVQENGNQIPSLVVQQEGAYVVLPMETPCCIETSSMRFAHLECNLPGPAIKAWLDGIPVEPKQVKAVSKNMELLLDQDMAVIPPKPIQSRKISSIPIPSLTFYTVPPSDWEPHYFQTGKEPPVHAAHVQFVYDGIAVNAENPHPESRIWDGKTLVSIMRNRKAETQALEVLADLGFRCVRLAKHWISPMDPIANWLTLREDHDFLNFLVHTLPELKRDHWIITQDPSFDLNLVEADGWYVDLEETSGTDWFDAELGVVIEGRQENLLPLLLEFIRQTPPSSLNRALQSDLVLTLSDGRKFHMPAERMRMLTSTLLELFSKKPRSSSKTLPIPRLRALELLQMDELQRGERAIPESLSKNLQRFKQLNDLPAVNLPKHFETDLREYQQRGLSWLQFLREMGLGAVLADDMGLGKTVQTLAHIQLEKEAGRMTHPCLIVAPTSVLYNWESETQRFTPELRVHVSHGPERKAFFETFHEYDLIVTSYPLLARDGVHFSEQTFHLVILDEAQFVRNHKTQAARTVRLLKGKQRIALTGTPLENHLDDLWSLFSFVVPGLLGEHALFRKLFRTPIERDANPTSRRLLAQRIAPFILRRTKNEVAHELPPKTEVIHRVELHPEQKDLYETVRISVEKKVRKSIQEKGVGRSHIIVLDALLKMRQVCCHPQLLKLKAASKVTASAKLDALRDLVCEMHSEGRRMLIFSQFVSMIKLIETMLQQENIEYVKITGQTRDRQTPIRSFQEGSVPVFLISLKAGGTGLNLTAADTVIHFDPWWNPAVENQATDRAHRIGQDKPIFVYKLIAAGTVEDKILQLQEKKSSLINSLLDEHKEILKNWDEEELSAFFTPLGEHSG